MFNTESLGENITHAYYFSCALSLKTLIDLGIVCLILVVSLIIQSFNFALIIGCLMLQLQTTTDLDKLLGAGLYLTQLYLPQVISLK